MKKDEPLKLWEALKRIEHAIGSDPTRSNLRTVRIEPYADGMIAVATDGHRLAAAMFEGNDHAATLDRDVARTLLKSKSVTVAGAALSECAFPDWPRVVPDPERSYVWDVSQNNLYTAVRRLYFQTKLESRIATELAKAAKHENNMRRARAKANTLMGMREGTKYVPIEIPKIETPTFILDADRYTIRIKTRTVHLEPESETLEVIGEQVGLQAPATYGVNADYLRDAVESIPRAATIQILDHYSPIVLRDRHGFEAIMPIRL